MCTQLVLPKNSLRYEQGHAIICLIWLLFLDVPGSALHLADLRHQKAQKVPLYQRRFDGKKAYSHFVPSAISFKILCRLIQISCNIRFRMRK